MKGLMKKSAAAVAAAVISVSGILSASAFGGVTENPTPVDKNDTALYWATSMGGSWSNAPGVPTVVDDKVVFTSGKYLKAIDKNTGEVLDMMGEMVNSTSFGITAPLYADGKIFVSEAGGVVQAFDAETFESLWVYRDPLGGQSNSEITYSDGYIYTGFWKSETADANLVCIPVEDTDPSSTNEEQAAAWTYTSPGGFYWSGAYCTDDFVIVGTDDGTTGMNSETAKLIVFDKEKSVQNGVPEIISMKDDMCGDLRSAVGYDAETDKYFITSKGKFIYGFKVTDLGEITDVQATALPGMSTSTPIAANGRVYIGFSGTGQFEAFSGAGIAVFDSETMELVYGLPTDGYPQSSALISDRDGENYVYFTANMTPGRVYVFHDNKDMTGPEKLETITVSGKEKEVCPVLFTPQGKQSQYCLSSLIADEDGTMYFKNDSNHIMALGSRVDSISVEGKTLYKEGENFDYGSLTVTATLANGRTKDVTNYAEYNAGEPLAVDDEEFSVSYDGMLYGDTDDGAGHEYGALYAELPITVLAESDYDDLEECKNAIAQIGEVTADSGELIDNARTLYDALPEDIKGFVDNYDILEQAEKDYKAILDSSSSEADSSSDADSSSETTSGGQDSSSSVDENSSNDDTSSDTSTSSVSDSTANSSSAVSSSSSQISSSAVSSAVSSSGASSSSSAVTSSAAGATEKNPATGGAAAVSLAVIIAGAAVTVMKKNK